MRTENSPKDLRTFVSVEPAIYGDIEKLEQDNKRAWWIYFESGFKQYFFLRSETKHRFIFETQSNAKSSVQVTVYKSDFKEI